MNVRSGKLVINAGPGEVKKLLKGAGMRWGFRRRGSVTDVRGVGRQRKKTDGRAAMPGYTRSTFTAPSRFISSEGLPMDALSRTRPHVLIADDERLIADTLALILKKAGFEAEAVYSGEKAVEAARSRCPDIFLADVMMPGMTGIDAAIAIAAAHPGCRILLLSGQAATADLLREARVRGHHFEVLLKPLHPEQLLARLRA